MTTPSSPTRQPARIADAFAHPGPIFSFEFFPPKTPAGVRALRRVVADLQPLDPTFVSVTYGAGGSTRGLTRDLVAEIAADTGITTMAHLSCVGHSRTELRDILDNLAEAGIHNVLAIRGDPPAGSTAFEAAPDGPAYASELVNIIKTSDYGFCVGGACHPEGHPEAEDRNEDIANLRYKVAAGVDFLITNLFFDNAHYFDFVTRLREHGITLPVLPGIMPITDFAQIQRFTRVCGATIPTRLTLQLEQCDTPDEVLEAGTRWALQQARDLLRRGAPGIHFYTLNKSLATRRVLEELRKGSPSRPMWPDQGP